jgi:hypothetical protein
MNVLKRLKKHLNGKRQMKNKLSTTRFESFFLQYKHFFHSIFFQIYFIHYFHKHYVKTVKVSLYKNICISIINKLSSHFIYYCNSS